MVMRRGDTESCHFQAPPPNSHSQARPGNAIKEAPPPNIYIFLYTMGRSRYHFLESQPHFLTCTVVNWIAIFSKPDLVEIVLNSLEFLQSQKRLALHSYVIMENHLHLIASAENLSKEIAAFKSFTARSIIDYLKENRAEFLLRQLKFYKQSHKISQEYQLWQEGSHPQAILNQQMFRQKLEYIHNNPVRRGYVDDPAHWRYSSYRNYVGIEGILAVDLIDV
ncbi:REP-associated tyrosine transposase [Chlorogloeopsis fritschii]|uniref:REP-associated tyrosine transposase n=1 Tax=Chlorogloeopsis fritschii TaxID=1124 RepID=UPI0023F0158D|nr:transposase [Chlorogloeopsis fritschii]